MTKTSGSITLTEQSNVWPHELRTAKILRDAGHKVVFRPANNTHRTADIYLDGVIYELKSPCGSSIDCVERNIKRGLRQSKNIVIDSHRIKNIKDLSILNYLKRNACRFHGLQNLIFISRKGEVVVIIQK